MVLSSLEFDWWWGGDWWVEGVGLSAGLCGLVVLVLWVPGVQSARAVRLQWGWWGSRAEVVLVELGGGRIEREWGTVYGCLPVREGGRAGGRAGGTKYDSCCALAHSYCNG